MSAATCGPGPGVDRVEDVSAINEPDGSAGTVLCTETFEHVFEVRRAFDEAAKGASQVPWCQKVGGPFRAPAALRDHADTPRGLLYPTPSSSIVTSSRSGGKKLIGSGLTMTQSASE